MICLMIIFGMGLLNIFVGSKGMDLVVGGLAAIVFALFIVYDTHVCIDY